MRILEKKNSLIQFGTRLRAIRESINLSQEQVHYATGITQPHISKIEAGGLNVGLSHIAILAEFFGLKEYELLQYDSPIPETEELKKNVAKFVKKNNIDPDVFLKKGLSHLLKNMILPSRFLTTPRYTKEIASFIEEKFEARFTTTAISQALENLGKKGLIERTPTDKKSKFQYKKK